MLESCTSEKSKDSLFDLYKKTQVKASPAEQINALDNCLKYLSSLDISYSCEKTFSDVLEKLIALDRNSFRIEKYKYPVQDNTWKNASEIAATDDTDYDSRYLLKQSVFELLKSKAIIPDSKEGVTYKASEFDDVLTSEDSIEKIRETFAPWFACESLEHPKLLYLLFLLLQGNFYKYAVNEKDITYFHSLIDDIGVIRILGGEPLLNIEINRYMELTRNLYPNARIYVVTNGMLLKSMPDSFYQTLEQNNILLSISFYPPMKDTMPGVLPYLDERHVNYTITPLNTEFGKKQLLEPQSDDDTIMAFYKCTQKMCNNFYDGKIAACFLPFTTKYFNETFDKNLPEDGSIDIYELGLTTRKLKERLMYPFLRCRYCSAETEMIPWDVMENPTTLSDWVKDE